MSTVSSFRRILVANRGEIAVRIIRTIRELGLESVAIYSDADEDSFHRKLADLSVRIPGRSSSETYLNIPKILEAAKLSQAEAIHPGYGFLSENAKFAKAIENAGLTFIGPSADSINMMGDKVKAKNLMKSYEVPTVPGSENEISNLTELKKILQELGFPVIIKAAAGGGGRGMRVVESISELESAYVACQREAGAYFDNPAVFVERYIANPRHIEIQVLCDGKNGISLFERDCSIQRRHQKLLEEAPSYFLNQDQRRHLGEIAVRAALAVGYQGAGTVEFICESPEQAYFMEMNTRIQVEHPVTEMITGVDLIAEQIRIAQGLGLRWHQDQLQVNGWAIEARINAEDPVQGFIPRPGKIEQIHLPQGPGIRVDTHIYPGYEIPSEYDSMIAKLIVWAPSRDEAIARLRRALQELEIKGVPTTAKFHQALLQDEDFQKGIFSTRFMENKSEDLLRSMTKTPIENNHIPQLVAAFLAQKSQVKVNLTENSQRKSWEEVGRLENQHRL